MSKQHIFIHTPMKDMYFPQYIIVTQSEITDSDAGEAIMEGKHESVLQQRPKAAHFIKIFLLEGTLRRIKYISSNGRTFGSL